jgi:hypothetical protein
MKLVRLRRTEAKCSLSYGDYRPKTNAAILWDRHGSQYGEIAHGRDRERKGK